MHETALMETMLALAAEHLAPYEVKRVNNITMRIGRLANVLPDAFSFAFDAMTREGPLAGAELILNHEPYTARCRDCGAVYDRIELPSVCPACGSHNAKLLSGTEVYLESIDFESE